MTTPSTGSRQELIGWIDGELTLYVKDMINDGDYATLRKNLIDIATAHAKNELASLGGAETLQPEKVCDCGGKLTKCEDCVVSEYQGAHTECHTCCPIRPRHEMVAAGGSSAALPRSCGEPGVSCVAGRDGRCMFCQKPVEAPAQALYLDPPTAEELNELSEAECEQYFANVEAPARAEEPLVEKLIAMGCSVERARTLAAEFEQAALHAAVTSSASPKDETP